MEGGLGIDPRILIGNIATFIVLAVILKKYAYRPFLAVLEKRRKEIESGVAKAEEAEKSLVKIRALGEEVKSAGEKRAKELIAEAQTKAQSRAAAILADAEEEKKKIVENARAAAEKERSREQERLSREALDLAMAVSEKFLAQKLTKDQDRKLIEKLAAEL
jgi:F-type H+-transporting ATPase subunit b